MTTSDHRKVFKQLNAKPIKKAKFIKHNRPKKRSCGIALRKCKNCGRNRGQVRKYDLNMCRQCFRDLAVSLGFKKYS
jgi:small subunit ribosomal protein S14